MESPRVQMCFLMDCTASMEPWIQAAKDQIRGILARFPGTEFEVAFVGYRDYHDFERFVLVPFTDVNTMLLHVQNIHAVGGDDEAEDIAGGLDHVRNLNWNAHVKTIVHIADAPAHGMQFHSASISDSYPDGDPDGKNPLDLLRRLSQMGIDYTFIRTDKSTDKMINKFHEAYVGPGAFKVEDLIKQGSAHPTRLLAHATARSITDSLTRYVSSHESESMHYYTSSQDPQGV